jgi:hypothetical protein
MKSQKMILVLPVLVLFFSCSSSKKAVVSSTSQPVASIKTDTVKKNSIKPYKAIITMKAITRRGLLTVHKVDERYYFEIGDSLLNKDILIVNRISKAAAALGYGGDYIGENVVQFVKGPNQKLFIKRISYLEISRDSSENGIYRSIVNSNLQPIVASFDIKAFSPDSAGTVIDMTDYLNGDNDVFFFDPKAKKAYGLGALQADKSYLQSIASFPLNTEIKTIKTYVRNDQLLTYELNSSLVLLPARQMRPRYNDERVGYFSRGYLDFDNPVGVKADYVITRWRMEPKEEDIAKYKRGELVEPKNPIIYFIDPATPKKWVSYLIQGVNDWQKAFQKAGFKNAIYALEAPTNDSTWSLDDARHNAIVYKASPIQNASGPHVSDPRTGEILETHINWYHNIQQLMHDWYMVQAGPNDTRARKMVFDDSLMGELIRYVCAHEVGHTLGLQHNFVASSTIPVDSLRSKYYVSRNSHTPSIMDYARFNYVAQPEDSIAVNDLIPRIGVYDEWAIEWGYRWLPDLNQGEEENTYMNKWIIQQLKKDKRLLFASGIPHGSRTLTEDLGDDAVQAGYYGIMNLQRIMPHLKEWTKTSNADYRDLARIHADVINQYRRYINLVVQNIGGVDVTPKTVEQEGVVYNYLPRQKIRSAVHFLQAQLFDNIEWLDDREIAPFTGGGSVVWMYKIQERVIHDLVSQTMYNWLLLNETSQSKGSSYTFDEFLADMENGIWKELNNYERISIYRRSVQNIYVLKLIDFIRLSSGGDISLLGGNTVVKDHIRSLYKKINEALPRYKDAISISHLSDLRLSLKAALDNNSFAKELPKIIPIPSPNKPDSGNIRVFINGSMSESHEKGKRGCWGNDDY